jgi:putative nucleotidyltransferase-like protein
MGATGLWEGVDRLLAQLEPDLASAHGLGPLAARRFRLRGEPVPEQLAREERAARAAILVVPALLTRIREAYDGPLILMKGPELTSRYPDGARRLADLDLLAGDAQRAQQALLDAGFVLRPVPVGPDYDRHHHLQPVEWPGIALPIEVHRRVAWPRGLDGPRNEELFEASVPAGVGVDGILAPDPHQHAVLLASHIWREVPMQKLRALVDVLAFTDDDDREELNEIARRWSFERGWSATLAAADWLLREGNEPGFVRYWARNLRGLREPTVFEMHLQGWLSPFTLTAPPTAIRLSAMAVLRDMRPRPREGWAPKARRTAQAVFHPLSAKSEHDRRSGQGRWRRRSAGSGERSK